MANRPQKCLSNPVAAILIVLLCLFCATPARAGQQQAPAAAANPCQDPLPELYKRVAPAVVLIRAASIDPYDMEHRLERVSGSGIIIDPSGLVLTNSHVVFGRAEIAVTLDDGQTLPAVPVGADPLFDIALVRIPVPKSGTLPYGRFGDSDRVQVGDEVYAIGNPLGLEQSLTRGIVSAVNRILPGATWYSAEPLIQTDAAINPGNSGGPLIDRCGNVIGITTAIIAQAQSIGFAIPSNVIKSVVPKLLSDGRLVRPWLGVQGQLVPPILKDLLRIPLAEGFLVEAVEPGSPAEKAGLLDGEFELTLDGEPILLGGDIITELNGIKLDDVDKLEQALKSLKVGAKIQLVVSRKDKRVPLDITVVERPLLPWDLPNRKSGWPSSAYPQNEKAAQSRHGMSVRARVIF